MDIKILKRIAIALGIVILLMLVAVAIGLANLSGFAGKGSAENPYLIKNAKDMTRLSANVSKGKKYEGKYFALDGDIDISGSDFLPIGYVNGGEDAEFAGTFDGRGHSINGADMDVEGNAGVFVCVSGRILNLSIGNAFIEGSECAGGIVAHLTESGRIYNCVSYASVHGETCGAVVGQSEGRLVNCVQLLDHEDSGSPYVTGDDDKADLTNCYTTQEGELKLTCNGYEENKLALRQRGLDCLNSMLTELKLSDSDVDFCGWELIDEFPFVVLTESVVDSVNKVSVDLDGSEEALEYDFGSHCFTSEKLRSLDSLLGITVNYEKASGSKSSMEIAEDVSQAYISTGVTGFRVECMTEYDADRRADGRVLETDNSASEGAMDITMEDLGTPEITYVNLDGIADMKASEVSEGLSVIRRGYYDETGTCLDTCSILVLASSGTYSISGSLDGCVRAVASPVMESSVPEIDLSIILDGVNISSDRMPCIDIPDCGNDGLLHIEVAKGSLNRLTGSNRVDIYSQGYKSEGVLSSKRPLDIRSEGGRSGAEDFGSFESSSLIIDGDLEGVECEGGLTIDGGNYDIRVRDDGVSCGGEFTLADGFINAECFDNGVDCDDVFLEGGVLTGAVMSGSEAFVKSHVRASGTTVAFEGGRNKLHEDSKQGMLELTISDSYPAGTVIVMADAADNPILALKYAADGREAGFSVGSIADGQYHFYICDKIDGDFVGAICQNVIGFDRSRPLTSEDGRELAIGGIEKRFKVNEE